MKSNSFRAKLTLAACVAALFASPTLADVKAGVDAWSSGNYKAAVKEWRADALKGNADAQFNMGQAYKLGRGVKTDLDVALDWYGRAARQGHLQASDSYGHLLHYQGKISDALPYLQASSSRGEPRAQYLLATELFNGVNVTKDWVRAYALMTRASSAGMAPASRSLAQMDQYIPMDQRQKAIVLAGTLEKQANKNRSAQVAGFPINTAPPKAVGRPVAVPPSTSSASTASGFPTSLPQPLPTNAKTAAPAPIPAPTPLRPAPSARPAPPVMPVASTAVRSGPWRIQLGAFSKEGNARSLWNKLESRHGHLASLQPYLKAHGSITRLQAGPFASRDAAESACVQLRASGQACISVRK